MQICGAISKHYHLRLCLHSVLGWSTDKFWVQELKAINRDLSLSSRWLNWPSNKIALAVSGHLGVQRSGSVLKRPLCRSQINCKNGSGHRQLTVRAGGPLEEVTFNAVTTDQCFQFPRIFWKCAIFVLWGNFRIWFFIRNCPFYEKIKTSVWRFSKNKMVTELTAQKSKRSWHSTLLPWTRKSVQIIVAN